jgi:hypothetical protein
VIAPEYSSFVAAQRRSEQLPAQTLAVAAGELVKPLRVDAKAARDMLRVGLRLAAGLVHPSKHRELLWSEGDNQLAVSLAEVDVALGDGSISVTIPVRCDQTGAAQVQVLFVCGSPQQPAGLYAAAPRRPGGPEAIVTTWGDALVAFAWEAVLGMVTGLSAATGKDQRGNVLVPVEMLVTREAIELQPMARHRFVGGSSGLKTPIKVGKIAGAVR